MVGCPNETPAGQRAWHARLRLREQQARGKRWQHVDGGCMLAARRGGKGYRLKGSYPCDDTYEDTRTKREVSFPVTACQHWEMPFAFDDPREVIGLPGVGKPKYRKPPTAKEEACSRKVGHLFPKSGPIKSWWRAYERCMRGGR